VEDVKFLNIQMSNIKKAGLTVTMAYTLPLPSYSQVPLPVLKNFVFQNITGTGIATAGIFTCLEGNPCSGITLNDVHLTSTKGFTCSNAHGVATDVAPTPCLIP